MICRLYNSAARIVVMNCVGKNSCIWNMFSTCKSADCLNSIVCRSVLSSRSGKLKLDNKWSSTWSWSAPWLIWSVRAVKRIWRETRRSSTSVSSRCLSTSWRGRSTCWRSNLKRGTRKTNQKNYSNCGKLFSSVQGVRTKCRRSKVSKIRVSRVG